MNLGIRSPKFTSIAALFGLLASASLTACGQATESAAAGADSGATNGGANSANGAATNGGAASANGGDAGTAECGWELPSAQCSVVDGCSLSRGDNVLPVPISTCTRTPECELVFDADIDMLTVDSLQLLIGCDNNLVFLGAAGEAAADARTLVLNTRACDAVRANPDAKLTLALTHSCIR